VIALNALAARAGGPAVRVAEVARRAPALWGCRLLVLHTPEARIRLDPSPDRLMAGWPRLLERAPAVPRRIAEGVVLRGHMQRHEIRAVLHYGTYVPLKPAASVFNVLCFVSLAPWEPGSSRRSARNLILRRLFEATHSRADLIVMQSQSAAGFLADRYPILADRIRVVPNGVEVPALERPAVRRGFVVVGDVHAYRRIEHVVRAYASLEPGVRAVHPLTVVGNLQRDAEATRLLRRTIADCGVSSVELRGLVPRQEVLARIAGAAALVSYASVENGPNAVMEAAAIGTPVVLADTPVHREFAGEPAFFATTPGQLRDAMHAAAHVAMQPVQRRTTAVDTWDVHVKHLGSLLSVHGLLPQPAAGQPLA
jgi:glycosyltransferase involved in cell wall biosynthesis